jgi:TetR/AcrR family transcriptional regulator, transcriptional repressor for nem operon
MNAEPDTRSRILSTAREMFHGRSYADVGIQEICDGARVQKGSFYHFFPSKRDLALAVIDDMADDWAHGFVAEAFDQNLPPVERLDYIIDAAYYWQKAAKDIEGRMPGCLFGNLALEVSTRDDVMRAKLNAVFDRARDKFRLTLDQAVAAGAMAPMNTEDTATTMLAFLEGIILLAKSRNDPDVILRLGPAIKTLRIELTQ